MNRRFRYVKLSCGVSKRVSFRHSCHKFSVVRCRLLDHTESAVIACCYVACLAALVVHGQSDCNRSVLICVRVANILFLFMMKMSFSSTWTYFVSFWCRIKYIVDPVDSNFVWYVKKIMHKKTPLFSKTSSFFFLFSFIFRKRPIQKRVYEKYGELTGEERFFKDFPTTNIRKNSFGKRLFANNHTF